MQNRRRRQRGAVMVEYVVLLVLVVLPCVAGALLCYVHVHSWYMGFVHAVSQPHP